MQPAGIREVTDEEVRHYHEHGWVKLDCLLSPDLVASLLERAQALMGPSGDEHVIRPGIDTANPYWHDRHNVVEEDERFSSVGLSARLGANAQRLMGRDVGVLLSSNLLAVKIGTKQGSPCPSTEPTLYHQDGADLPVDRVGWVDFWIALDHITLEMGAMQFVDRSHQLGLLGHLEDGLLDVYPQVGQMKLTDPSEFQPGDATAHHMYTVHCTPSNDSEVPRWAMILTYIPADTVYTGGNPWAKATHTKLQKAGLNPGDVFGGPMYPRVYG
jgi:hypothetical protein